MWGTHSWFILLLHDYKWERRAAVPFILWRGDKSREISVLRSLLSTHVQASFLSSLSAKGHLFFQTARTNGVRPFSCVQSSLHWLKVQCFDRDLGIEWSYQVTFHHPLILQYKGLWTLPGQLWILNHLTEIKTQLYHWTVQRNASWEETYFNFEAHWAAKSNHPCFDMPSLTSEMVFCQHKLCHLRLPRLNRKPIPLHYRCWPRILGVSLLNPHGLNELWRRVLIKHHCLWYWCRHYHQKADR